MWLVVCCAALLGGTALPWTIRVALGLVLIAVNLPILRMGVLLRGSRAVRTLEWNEEERFYIGSVLRAGFDPQPLPALLLPGSFRLGIAFLVLWFSTPAGLRVVLIDGGRQDPVAFRRLSRRLARVELIPSRPKV
jgi:hypothetical protein